MKAAIFDIETTALEAVGAGIILCVCIRPLSTQKTRDFRLKFHEKWNSEEEGFLEAEERELLQEVVQELGKYDLLIGHNIEQFDLPYIRSRCYQRGVPFSLTPFTYDTMKAFGRTKFRTVLNGFRKPTKALDMVADFLRIDNQKTKIYPAEHWLTIWGNAQDREESMHELLSHCQRDVRMNAQIYSIMLPFDMKGTIRRWM